MKAYNRSHSYCIRHFFKFSIILHLLIGWALISAADSQIGNTNTLHGAEYDDYEDEYAENATFEESERPKETIAQVIGDALKEEFKHEEELQSEVGKHFQETVSQDEGTRETVVIISHNRDRVENSSTLASTVQDGGEDTSQGGALVRSETGGEDATATNATNLDFGAADDDVEHIIDSHDNEYVLSRRSEEVGVTLDPQLIRELGLLVVALALGGVLMEALGQPAINGFFIAGSLVGPGGLQLINEIVQIQSLSQIGVLLLLFCLGIEFNLGKLRSVRDVALLGGALEVAFMSALGGLGALAIGAGAAQGTFVGALLAMSSTSIVVKCLQEARATNTPHGQITIGTLVLQDCIVGILFALMPILGLTAAGQPLGLTELLRITGRVLGKLSLALVTVVLAAKYFSPRFTATISRFSPATFQLSLLGFCFTSAIVSSHVGISGELGAFLAGVTLSRTEQQEAVLESAEQPTNFFLALFIASTGLAIAPVFLMEHILVLMSGVALILTAKGLIVTAVVLLFRYPLDTALSVGINLAQIGEFGFVLLSMANQRGIIGNHVHLLLMGTTALSLLLTPFLLQISVRIIVSRNASGHSVGNDVELAVNDSRVSQVNGRVSSRRPSSAIGRGGTKQSEK